MNKEVRVALTKNLLEGKTCSDCNREYRCNFKLKNSHNTCRMWKKKGEGNFSFRIASYPVSVKPRQLKCSWTKEAESILESYTSSSISLLEENEHAKHHKMSDWSDKGAMQLLADKSCTTCSNADTCNKEELNTCGFCDGYVKFDNSLESIFMREITKQIKTHFDQTIADSIFNLNSQNKDDSDKNE